MSDQAKGPSIPCQRSPTRATCRSCQTCRRKKTKCDGRYPKCGACRLRQYDCEYAQDGRRSAARVKGADVKWLQGQIEELKAKIQSDYEKQPAEKRSPSDPPAVKDLNLPSAEYGPRETRSATRRGQQPFLQSFDSRDMAPPELAAQGQDHTMLRSPNPSSLSSRQAANPPVEEEREMQVYGATSLLHDLSSQTIYAKSQFKGNIEDDKALKYATRDKLISHAAITRQREAVLYTTPSIASNMDFDNVPMDMAMHLLNLHWNRLHYQYLLTYRPAIMESMMNNGPYVNKLLLNAIYLQSSMYNDRDLQYLDPDNGKNGNMFFYSRFKTLLVDFIDEPTMPTIVALLLCSGCLVPMGKQSAGWVYAGMAYKMMTDLGYHLDAPKCPQNGQELSAIDMELRRRVYWGAYSHEKSQCLFLGRAPSLHQADSNIPCELLDSYEEMEEWKPYHDPQARPFDTSIPAYRGRASHALSTFELLRQLNIITAHIIESFYSIKSTRLPISTLLQAREDVREELNAWRNSVPSHLQFEPGRDETPPPHQITPHTTYWTLVILTEQAFLNRGNFDFTLDSASQTEGKERCIRAALQIRRLVEAYRNAFTLRRAQYGISYATYAAVLIMLQYSDQEREGYTESIQFFWRALLEYQKAAGYSLKTPMRLLKSLMHRVENVTPGIRVDDMETTDWSASTLVQTESESRPRPSGDGLDDMDSWNSSWLDAVSGDLTFADDTIFGIFMHN